MKLVMILKRIQFYINNKLSILIMKLCPHKNHTVAIYESIAIHICRDCGKKVGSSHAG